MSIGSALSNALSGLGAAAKSAELISSNVSNALTPGYAKRDLIVSSRHSAQGGVKIDVVLRHENKVVINERRLGDAKNEYASARSLFFNNLINLIGEPGSGRTLSDDISNLESKLIEASGLPKDTNRLQAVFNAASTVAQRFKNISRGIQQERLQAENTINEQVRALNLSLNALKKLNRQLVTVQSGSDNTASLMDERNQLLDKISKIIPFKVFERGEGKISLYSTSGQMLIDSDVAKISFEPTRRVNSYSDVKNNTLSKLQVKGHASASNFDLKLTGGTLAAAFEIRDAIAPKVQSKLDDLAVHIAKTFGAPEIDSSLSENDPGLFTDRGAKATSDNQIGLSARLEINARVDPSKGGALWRIREGIGIASSVDEGSSDLLVNLATALHSNPGASHKEISIFDQTSFFLSNVTLQGDNAETEASFHSSFLKGLKLREQSHAVNTDHEMQHLLQVKQAFAANAKVIKAVDEMLSLILKIK